MRSRLSICLSLCLLGGLFAGAPAEAAKKRKQPASKIKLVAPMRVTVGKTIVIRGTGFSARRGRNTVIFRGADKRSAFAKPRRAGRRRLVVRIPASVERILVNRDDKGVGSPTRLRLRVLVQRRYGRLSLRRNSPVVESALQAGGVPPAACGNGSDFDGDLIPNSTEAAIKTDPCNSDTDGDGIEDGFEQQSALDLNQRAVPYPGKRPYPNALDASDATDDYDGDALSQLTEFRAWAKAAVSPPASLLQGYTDSLEAPAFGGPYGGVRTFFGNHTLPLSYSDGDQTSLDVRPGHPEYQPYLDFKTPGVLSDDERDADGDGLRNIDESHNRGAYDQNDEPSGFAGNETFLLMSLAHYEGLPEDCTFEYTPVLPRPMLQPDYLDPDSDGDGVWDGNDDQDNDRVSNVDEIKPPHVTCGEGESAVGPLPFGGARNGATIAYDGKPMRRAPYNPCLPYRSEFCTGYKPR